MSEPLDILVERSATVLAPLAAAVIFFIRFLRSDRTYHNTSLHLEQQVEKLRKRVDYLEQVDDVRDRRERAFQHYIVQLELMMTKVGLDVPEAPDWEELHPIPPFRNGG